MTNYATYRLANNEIRPGESPQDTLLVVRQRIDLGPTGALTNVTTPFKEGSQIAFFKLYQAEVGADGVVDVTDTTDGGVVIMGKSLAQQIACSLFE